MLKLRGYLKDKAILNWMLRYYFDSLCKSKSSYRGLIHVLLCVVDHFEPFNGDVELSRAEARINKWAFAYPKMASRHRDSDGRTPQHCWFYPPHHDQRFLKDLVKLCTAGYGEIEMHLHHNRMPPFPDTADSLKMKILRCIDEYSRYGIFCHPDGTKTFGFIHGDWSLDNSRGNSICGVNNEISILKECGCYADFTFPSLGEAQPATINRIYYAYDDPDKPKSYNNGKEIEVMGNASGDLLMVPGILGIRWRSRVHGFKPSIEASNLDNTDYPFPGRIDYLIRNGIRIKGRPEWAFIKLHTHGALEETWDSLMGEQADAMFSYLESAYNDGTQYVLHYVTAREMYNIIKAAEAGKMGNPNVYRDFVIPKYVYLNKE